MAKILLTTPPEVSDEILAPDLRTRLESLGSVDQLEGRQLPDNFADTWDVLVTGWETPCVPAVSGTTLRLIAHSAGTMRGIIDPDLIASGQIAVSQAGSDPMARAVAEHALASTLVMLRELHTYDRGMQSTRDWATSRQPALSTAIHTQRHGLIGLSRTGQWHARMLKGLGVREVVAFDPYFSPDAARELGVELVSLSDAMSNPVVAVHAPVTEETRRMIGPGQLDLMPEGGLFVNTARSAVICMDALEERLVQGRLRAVLDVFEEEPLPSDYVLFGLPNVMLTPHVAGATVDARHEMGEAVVDEVERFLNGQPLQFQVDPARAHQLS